MKFTVKKIDNGWVVKFSRLGLSMLKEPYDGGGEFFIYELKDLVDLVDRVTNPKRAD